jgi:hypothetical protein
VADLATIEGLHLVDPGWDCTGAFGHPSHVACSLAGGCLGHETGKLTAVADANEEVRHYATSERAARRWLRRHNQGGDRG